MNGQRLLQLVALNIAAAVITAIIIHRVPALRALVKGEG